MIKRYKHPRKYSSHVMEKKLKELFIIAENLGNSAHTKAKIKMPKLSIQQKPLEEL